MAIPVYQSVGAAGGSADDAIVVPAPSGIANGDVLLALIQAEPDSQAITPPAGFTSIVSLFNTGYTFKLELFWKRAASESGSYTFDVPGNAWGSGAIARISGAIAAGSPIDVVGVAATGNGTSAAASSVTTLSADTLLCYCASTGDGTPTITPPAGMDERFDHPGLESNVYLATEGRPSAGVTGIRTGTINVTQQWAAVLLAIKPAEVPLASVTVAGPVTTGNGNLGDPSLSFDWNNSANANYLAVCVGAWSPLPTGVTYNGIPMTQLVSGDFNNYTARIYGLAHPPLGNHAVVVSFSDDISEAAAAAIGLANVNIANPVGIADSAGASGGNLTLAPNSVAGALAVGVLFCHANPTPGGTQQFELNPVSGFSETYFNGQTVIGAPVTVNVSWTMATNQRVGAAIAFLPGAGGETIHESVAFGLSAGVSPAARAIFGSALSLSTAAAIVPPTSRAILPETLSLTAAATIDPPTARAVIAAALSLSTTATIEPPARLVANLLTTLSAQAAMSPAAMLSVIVQVALSSQTALATESQRALAGALTLTAGTSMAPSSILTGIGRVTLTAAGLADVALQVSVPTLVSLGAAAALAPSSQATWINTVALTADASVAPASRLIASALQAFTAAAALDAFTGEQIIQEQLSLTVVAGVSPTARAVLIARHTLELAAQIETAKQAIVHVAVQYVAQASISSVATGVLGAQLALDVQSLIQARSIATMHNAVTLAVATALESAAALANAPAAGVLKAVADELRAATAIDETLTA